ncbi:MAG TPA: CHAT domain-containing protein, partial [Bacteroidales bacterium]|nr:CHAT domain-containing protein [Bacteroidales bacterium]
MMDRFYYYLSKGQSKSEALRNSKLDFLANADQLKSNPYFWSSFVIIGNSEPVYSNSNWKMILELLLIISTVPLVILLLYRKYKKDANIKST